MRKNSPNLPAPGKQFRSTAETGNNGKANKAFPDLPNQRNPIDNVSYTSTLDSDEPSATKAKVNLSQYSSTSSSYCLGGLFRNCITNICLPSVCGITRFQSKRYKEEHPRAQEMINSVLDNSDVIYKTIHLRLMPAVRPLLQLLYFPESQIEADGLTRISGQVWASTYLLQSELKPSSGSTGGGISLNIFSQKDFTAIKDAYLELAWEVERAFLTDTEFYSIHQRFKKQILPEIWNLEDNYSGSKKDFVDPELRDDLTITRPFDGLYTLPEFRLTKKLQLVIISKSHPPDISNLSHEERRIPYSDLPKENKLNLIISLINISIGAIGRLNLSLTNHIESLSEAVFDGVNGPTYNEKNCSDSIMAVGSSLKKIWRDVRLSTQKETELTDRVCVTIENVTAYLETTQWICDRLAEISQMTELCYDYLKYVLKIDLPTYDLVRAEAVQAYQQRKNTGSAEASIYPAGSAMSKRNLKRDFQAVKNKLLLDDLSNGENKNIGPQRAEHPFKAKSMSHMMEVETLFLCTEYHTLMQKIPMKIEDMRLMFVPE